MPLKVVFITIVWIPGNLAFANKTRRIFDDHVQTAEQLADDMLSDIAIKLKRKTMTPDSLESVRKDMYYEIYETPESRHPFSKSSNAP